MFKTTFMSYTITKPRGKQKLGEHNDMEKGVSPTVRFMA